MGETYGLPEDEPTVQERAEPIIRTVIAGHPQAAVRRITLYWLAIVSLVVGLSLPPVLAVTAGALVLLAMTDQLA